TVRAKRGIFTRSVVAATAALLLLLLGGPWSTRYVNPRQLSLPHSSLAFARKAGADGSDSQGCGGCHVAARRGVSGWVEVAFRSEPGPLDLNWLSARTPAHMAGIDSACLKCHGGHDLHQPSIEHNLSC